MSLHDAVGASYGPYQLRISPEKVAEYVAVTGDEPDRWLEHAPPAYAGALLFAAAPHFLNDPRVQPYTGTLVHVDQAFTWHGPLVIGTGISVAGKVEKARERSGRFFVTFVADVVTTGGERLIESTSTFLMGEAGDGAGPSADGGSEPPAWKRELNEVPLPQPWSGIGRLRNYAKSASRIDLVKYAAASGDFNPIHFDHDAARAAGLDGIVVHGLLMAAWAMQVVTAVTARPDPIAHCKLRFRNPLKPGEQASAGGAVTDVAGDESDAQISIKVSTAGTDLVVGTCVARLGG